MNEYQRWCCTATMFRRFRSNASACCPPQSEAVEGHAWVLSAAAPPTAAPPPSSPAPQSKRQTFGKVHHSKRGHEQSAQHNLLSTARWIFMQPAQHRPSALPRLTCRGRAPARRAAQTPCRA